MIDTVLLCMAWATFGYALAIIHLDRETRYRHTTSGWPPTRSNAVVTTTAENFQTYATNTTISIATKLLTLFPV